MPPIRKPTIVVDPLFELVPDLRAEVARFDATIAGEPLPRTAGEIEGLEESGFGLIGDVVYRSDGAAVPPPAA